MKLGPSSPSLPRRRPGARTGLRLGALIFALCLAGDLAAQAPRNRAPGRAPGLSAAQPRGDADPIKRHLFSPEVVMRLRREISLTEPQEEALIAELQSAQSDLVPLRFRAQEAQDDLARLIREDRLDEERVLQQARRVMDSEAQVRARHLALLVRIKNLLTPDQQRRLQEVQRLHRARRTPRR